MRLDHENFTMSFAQARDFGIDYRDYEKVAQLPERTSLTAVAGVWGDNRNVRCLFVDAQGKRYMRNIVKWGDAGYVIKELGVDAKAILVGEKFTAR